MLLLFANERVERGRDNACRCCLMVFFSSAIQQRCPSRRSSFIFVYSPFLFPLAQKHTKCMRVCIRMRMSGRSTAPLSPAYACWLDYSAFYVCMVVCVVLNISMYVCMRMRVGPIRCGSGGIQPKLIAFAIAFPFFLDLISSSLPSFVGSLDI